jgi:hypothetical protein
MAGRVELSASTWRQPWPPPINPGRSVVLGPIADRILTRAAGLSYCLENPDDATAAGYPIEAVERMFMKFNPAAALADLMDHIERLAAGASQT